MVALRQLWVNNRSLVIFVMVDMAIYTATILLYVTARLLVSPGNFKLFQVLDWLLIVATLINSFSGAKAFYTEAMSGLVEKEPELYEPLSNLINAMLWLRFSFVILVLLVVFFLGCYLMYLVVQRRSNQEGVDAERIKRLPMVRLFLTQRARRFDPS